MDAIDFPALARDCAPLVHVSTAKALVDVESAFNPHAIGVVGGVLQRQPRHRAEAVATAKQLLAGGWNFSVGLAQINVRNFGRLGLTVENAFEPCTNLRAMQAVLSECVARTSQADEQHGLRQALSCYYSGNLTIGFRHGYVQRVAASAATRQPP